MFQINSKDILSRKRPKLCCPCRRTLAVPAAVGRDATGSVKTGCKSRGSDPLG